MLSVQKHDSVAFGLSIETEAARNLLATYAEVLADDAELTATTIEGETDLLGAIERACRRIGENDAFVDGLKGHIASLVTRMERFKAQTETLRTAICVAMEVASLKRHEMAEATITLKAVPAKAEITDESAIPAKFWKPSDPKLDRKAVLDALKAKETIPGATLSNGGLTIMIKRS